MLSLGILHQQKTTSLQAQEAEAHQLFLRVIDLMRSSRLVDQVEAVALCGSCCSRFQSPVIVNSAFMRLAEAFRNGSSTLQMEILRVIQRNAEHLPKIRNYTEFIRPISEVIYSNDPDARAVTLRLLAAIAVSIPNQLDAHHAVRMALQSNDRTELRAALHACLNIVKVAGKFAEEVAHDIVTLIGRPGLSDDIRIAAIQILPYLSGSQVDMMMVADKVSGIIGANKAESGRSFRLIQTCLQVQSDLLARLAEPEPIIRHCAALAEYIGHPWPEVYKPACLELLRFFRLCMSQLSPEFLTDLLVNLIQSDHPRVSKQGIKCAYVVAYDPVTWDVLETLDERLVFQLTQRTKEFRDASGACAFSVLCRVVPLVNGTATPEVLQSAASVVSGLYEHLMAITAATEDSAMLGFVLRGLSPINLEHFPQTLFDHVTTSIVKYMNYQKPRCSLMCLKYLYQLASSHRDLVSKIFDQCFSQSNFRDVEENEKFQMVFHMVALRFAVTVVPDEREMALDVVATGLSLFSLYRLARTALSDGRPVFAMVVLEHLSSSSELENMTTTSNWIKVLLSFTQAESLKVQLLSNVTVERQNEMTKKSIEAQNDLQMKLTEFSPTSGHDKFRKAYLELAVHTQHCLMSLINTAEELRLRASVSPNFESVVSFLPTHFLGCIENFRSGAKNSAQLYRTSFDADGPSLGVLRYHFAICVGFGEILSAIAKRPFSVDEGIQLTEPVCVRGAEEKLAALPMLKARKLETAEEFYHWLKELYHLCSFFLSKVVPLPRYFLQKFQQTIMSVSLTPAQPGDKDFAQVLNMDTKFALKVDGAISTDKRTEGPFIRQVSRVRIKLWTTLEKSLPFSSKALHGVEIAQENMVQDVMLEERSFFSHTFVMFLGYPGLYKIHVDFELHDQNLVEWDPRQPLDLMVKVVEGRKYGADNLITG